MLGSSRRGISPLDHELKRRVGPTAWRFPFARWPHDPPTPAPAGAPAGHASGPTLPPDMSNHDDTWQHLTVSEAAERLGISTALVRRMVRAGKLEGNTVLCSQGKTYVVRLPREA